MVSHFQRPSVGDSPHQLETVIVSVRQRVVSWQESVVFALSASRGAFLELTSSDIRRSYRGSKAPALLVCFL
jgi:hypothetical protein